MSQSKSFTYSTSMPSRKPIPSDTDDYPLPSTSFSHTYNRKREVSRSGHQGREPAREAAQVQAQQAHAHAHEHGRNTGSAPGPFNHNNFHYNQKTRRRSPTSRSPPRGDIGGSSYYYFLGDDNSDFDDDIDRDDFDEEEGQYVHDKANASSYREPGRSQLDLSSNIRDRQRQRVDDDSPAQLDANEKGNQKRAELDQFFTLKTGDDDTLSTTNLNQYTESTTVIAAATATTTTTHRRDPIEFRHNNHYDYQARGAISAGASYSQRLQQRQQQQHQQVHPRVASSSAFYNDRKQTQTHHKSISTSRSPVSPPWHARPPRNRTSPPTAPPRVSSLLPPPRNNNSSSTRLPLSTSTSNHPITAIIPEQSVSPNSNSNSNLNLNLNPTPDPTLISHSSNAILHEAPTHAQFATSFLDPLNNLPLKPGTSNPNSASAVESAGSSSHKRIRSRSSSIGAVGDSLRNLNRWSSSTASSRLSVWDYHHYQQQQAQQQKLSRFSRRMSVDSIGLLSQPSADTVQDRHSLAFSSPRKLNKRRPSEGNTSTSPKPRSRSRSRGDSASRPPAGSGASANDRPHFSGPPLPPPSAPPPNLPPIVSLPPLDTDQGSFRLGSPTPRAMSRASPALNTPNSVFASHIANGEPRDYFWSDLSNPSRTASPAMRVNNTLLPPAPVTRDRDADRGKRGHSRSRSATKGSGDSSTKGAERSGKPSQKAMLSRALDKANTAVKLDKAENYTNARDAYVEACELLQQVLSRTNGEDDRKKLDAIRRTYTSRIEELDALVPENSLEEKALPARPDSLDTAGLHYPGVQIEMAGVDNRSDAATFTRSNRDESPNPQISSHAVPPAPSEPNGTIYSDFSRGADAFHPSFSGPLRRNFEGGPLTIPRSDNAFLPAPLSPFRPSSPAAKPPSPEPVVRQDFSLAAERERLAAAAAEHRSHRRNLSHESGSWLDPINESGGSADSSPHSRSSSRNIRKHIRLPSGNTEAEFDAALDAAVEAAYDDSYERPATYDEAADDSMTLSRRKVELAKERVREVEREVVIEAAREHERQRQMSVGQESQTYGGGFFDANDSDEEEERMLDEMARSYGMDDFALSQSSRYHQSSVPRESDSSGLTSRTWHSSMQSNPPTGTTTLSTVSEMAGNNASSPPSMPPPTQSLPQPPVNNRLSSAAGMRSRRSSSQNAKQLKIETSKLGPPPSFPLPKPAGGYIAQQRQQALSSTSTRGPFSSLGPSSPVRGTHSSSDAVAAPMSPLSDHEEEEHEAGSPTSVPPGMGMRKNFSSSSLRSLKTRQLSTASHLDEHDPSPVTPLSRQVSNTSVSRQPMMPALPTPLVSAFAEKMGGHLGGLSLFDSDFHQFDSPRSSYHPHLQQQQSPDIPLPLEPCPSEAMLRPFWLMRALYQTLAHPRGGYLSTRLFVPREAWKVKGVKLRNVEDKVSQCDLVTAALLKLARVDSTDADALLHEMESLEVILDSVQATLVRRLGTEVGSQGVGSIKDDGTSEMPSLPRNNSVTVKSGGFSWRRLRSKGSAVNLASTYGAKANGSSTAISGIAERDVVSPGGSMPSLPMVAHPSSRVAKRDVASVKFDGPNANYMASLARLFDAAQTVDQIARQVDDPGLRHADKTQVGLELCTRHAAEFFGFYICRFVLSDLGMLLDKYVKRGSEWVLS